MDTSNLSSNWKKLQATLTKAPTTVNKPADNGPSTQSMKRKASHDLPSKGSTSNGVKRSRKVASSTYSAPTTGKPRRMGSYLSKFTTSTTTTNPLVATATTTTPLDPIPQPLPTTQPGKYIAIDCEMVGTHSLTPFAIRQRSSKTTTSTATAPPEYSILARVSLVSYASETLYDAYVLPPAGVAVCDYRTPYSGITAWHLSPGNATTAPRPFADVQAEVAALIAGRILVGHALSNDLAILGLSHPKRSVRDTARYPGFRTVGTAPGGKSRAPSLKKLAHEVLGWEIQNDEKKGHSSVEDARAAMALFRREKDGFEREVARLYGRPGQVKGKQQKQQQLVVGRGDLERDGEEDEVDDEEAERRQPKKKKRKNGKKK